MLSDGDNDLFRERSLVPAKADGRGGARAGSGRPKGALNQVNRDLRTYLENLTGKSAIVEQYRLAAVAVLTDEAELIRLGKLWNCTRLEVVDRVGKAADRVFPRVYPSLGAIEVRPAGAPDNPMDAADPFARSLFDLAADQWTNVTPSTDDLPDEQ